MLLQKRKYMPLCCANFILLTQKCVKLTLRKRAKRIKQECMECQGGLLFGTAEYNKLCDSKLPNTRIT